MIDRLPKPIEAVFNTPSHHRVHHGANPQYLDKNYGGILILWDRWFGTFEPEVRRIKYGLTTNIETFNPLRIGYHEFIDIARDVPPTQNYGAIQDVLNRELQAIWLTGKEVDQALADADAEVQSLLD